MNIDTNTMISISEANQNVSKVARLVDQYSSAVILKNNTQCYMIVEQTVGKIFLKCDNNIASRFIEKSLEKNMKLGISTVNDFIEEWKELYGDILQQNIFLAVIIAICSVISVISTLCVTIVLKKKEYGVRIAFGSSIQQIILSYTVEMIVSSLISGIISFLFCYNNYAGQVIDPFREIHLSTLCTTSVILHAKFKNGISQVIMGLDGK